MNENTDTTQQEQSDTAQTQPTDEKRFSQADLDRVVTERLARQKAAYEGQQQKAKQEAEARQLEEQKRFQELAEQRQKELEAIKPKAEQADTYEQLVKDLLDEQRKDLPKPILSLLDKLSVVDQVTWIKENKAEIVKQQATSHDINAGNRSSSPSRSDAEQNERQRLLKTGRYTAF